MRRLSDEQINALSSEVKLLFGCVKYSRDIKKLKEFIEKDRVRFENLSQETYEIIAVMTKTNKLLEEMKKVEKGGRYNMCKAIDDMIEEGRQAGLEEGRQEGRQEGMVQSRCISIKNVMKSLNIAIQEAMDILCVPQSEQDMYRKLLKKQS